MGEARRAAVGRLHIAEGLGRLEALGGWRALGFPTLDSYGRERLGRSGRWLGDVRALGRRLDGLPLVRAAFLGGQLSVSKVELVARLCAALGDMDEVGQQRWVEAATELDVRQLRALVRECRQECESSGESDVRERWVRLARRVDRVDAMAFEQALMLARAVGARTRAEAVEAVLAEGMTELLSRGEIVLTDLGPRETATREDGEWGSLPAEEVEPVTWGSTLEEIDDRLVALARELAARDLALGRLGLESVGVVRDCQARLGIAASSMAARVALARRVEGMPDLGDALVGGVIGFEAATLLGRVARTNTIAGWLELAKTMTVKQLREAVDAAELHARVNDYPVEPPDAYLVEAVREVERQVLAVAVGRDSVNVESDVRDTGTVELSLSLPEDIATFWRDLEAHYEGPESFLVFVTCAMLKSWRGSGPRPAYWDVYLRDRFRCQSPVCTSRNVTPHHIRFRSHGGGEERDNLVSLCETCHLELVHGGRLTVTGAAPGALRWEAQGWVA